ncbi:MAG: flagellar motor stator protein MotA [Gammaproteobacteria bacterium]|nr:flagellar motor stator protein MotA [Gammaproteobacteria bacterium]
MNIIIGIIVILGCVLAGFVLAGGQIMALFQPLEVLIICGAALGAMIISNPLSVTIGVMKSAGALFSPSRYTKALYLELLALLHDIFNKIRREGLIAIENDIEDPHNSPIFAKYPMIVKDHHAVEFIADYLRIMVVGDMAAHELDALMEQELDGHHQEAALVPTAISKVADGLPGFGIVAAVLGIVITMGSLGGPPEELGHHVASALVGTLLGILFAYGFAAPFAMYLEHKMREEGRFYECIKACLIATVNGVPPQVAVEFGRKILYHSVRPGFTELEERVRQK